LFEYAEIISNGTLTKYYSNTVRDGHLKPQSAKRKSKTSNSLTSWWAGRKTSPSPS
jgi:type I restriction enzyme R subunit